MNNDDSVDWDVESNSGDEVGRVVTGWLDNDVDD